MKNQAQLIAYVDRLSGGTFRDLRHLLEWLGSWDDVAALAAFTEVIADMAQV